MIRVRRLVQILLLLLVLSGCDERVKSGDADRLSIIEEMYEGYRAEFSEVPEVTVEGLLALQRLDEVVVVDARTPEEWDMSMIPGAITREEFEANKARYAGSTVVTYCTIGARSGRYAGELLEQGFSARNLVGSVLAWTHAGGELVDSAGLTNRVHVYGSRWNLAAEGYEAVW